MRSYEKAWPEDEQRDRGYNRERRGPREDKHEGEKKPEDKVEDKPAGEDKKDEHHERGDRRRQERGDKKGDGKFEKRRYDDGPPIEGEPDVQGMTFEEFKAHIQAKKMNLQKAKIREHDNTKEKKTGGLEEVKKQDEKVKQINSHIKDIDTYNLGVAKGENDGLLGFQGGSDGEDDGRKRRDFRDREDRPFKPRTEGGNFFDRSRGGGRGRGGRDADSGPGARGGRGGRGEGGAARPKNLLSAENFPTLQ